MKTKYAIACRALITLPIEDDDFATVMEDWHVDVGNMTLVVPAGFKTNGASIPRFLWRVCGHPLEAPRVYAATAHDWLYSEGHAIGVSRAQADEIYYLLLRHFGVAAWRAIIEYYALRLFGGAHYVKGNK